MGKIRDWSSQGSGQPITGYEKHVFFPWVAITSNVDADSGDPTLASVSYADYQDFFGLDTVGSFNIATELYSIRTENNGNIYDGVTAFDPTDELKRIEGAVLDMERDVRRYAGPNGLADAAREGVKLAELIISEDRIDVTVAAERDRLEVDYLAAKSNVLMDIWIGGAILTTQVLPELAVLENGFNREIAAFSAKLRADRESARSQYAIQIMGMYMSQTDRAVALRQVYVAVAMDALKIHMTARQDQNDKNVEYNEARAFWNIRLLMLALNANSGIYGAQIVPPQQTNGQRLLAMLTGSASLAIQSGQATGSPAAGLAFGGLNFLGQALLG